MDLCFSFGLKFGYSTPLEIRDLKNIGAMACLLLTSASPFYTFDDFHLVRRNEVYNFAFW